MEIKLFLDNQVSSIIEYEYSRLPEGQSDIQKEMASWDQPWRKESLNHYSQLGWSFVALDGTSIKGYILGQPLLFFNNWTQCLWIEGMSFDTPEVAEQLLETCIRWSKTKHLQKVIFNSQSPHKDLVLEKFPKFKESGYLHLSTTKISEA